MIKFIDQDLIVANDGGVSEVPSLGVACANLSSLWWFAVAEGLLTNAISSALLPSVSWSTWFHHTFVML